MKISFCKTFSILFLSTYLINGDFGSFLFRFIKTVDVKRVGTVNTTKSYRGDGWSNSIFLTFFRSHLQYYN